MFVSIGVRYDAATSADTRCRTWKGLSRGASGALCNPRVRNIYQAVGQGTEIGQMADWRCQVVLIDIQLTVKRAVRFASRFAPG